MARPFEQVDVFGSEAGVGNPLAVVSDADGLDDVAMQRLANWTNLSETTFLLAPTEPTADYRVRIFTTERELPFAGHPTLGSAHAWLSAHPVAPAEGTHPPTGQDLVQECGAGLVRLRRRGGRLAFAAPPLIRSGPLDDATIGRVLRTLGVGRGDIVDHAWTDNGPGWATVLLASAQQVLGLTPRPGGERNVGVVGLHPDGTPEVRALVTTPTGPGGEAVREDPVTGSLNAGIATWLLGAGRLRAPYVARQGTALRRGGRVHVEVDDDATVWVGGATRTVVRGTIDW